MKPSILVIAVAVVVALLPSASFAHCDSLLGPVVADGRAALKSGHVDPVLKWVTSGDEPAVRAAFAQAMAVRDQSDAARELADRWFFETVVRLHRASEGEPFTGLREPGWKPAPLIELADDAVDQGTAAELEPALVRAVTGSLRERMQRMVKAKAHAGESVAAGRAYVAAYTDLVHFVEMLDVISSEHGKESGEPQRAASATK